MNSEPTSYFDDPSKKPEYSIMNWWDYGNWILYLSKRPVVANNFQAGVADSARFFISESEQLSTDIMDSRSSRYVVIEYEMLYNKFHALAKWADVDPTIYLRLEDYETELGLVPLQKLLDTTMARLYLFDGVGMNRFRLVHESSTLMGANPPKSEVKIFEYVPGALIRVQSEPDQRAGALVNLTSNQGRPFTYVSEGQSVDGGYEIRVPYSTEGNETWAKGPYLVFAGSERGVKMQNINVSEEDVLLGKTIDVSL
jgi:asparagine N-glycosylation enzyme membrane subunit Stt3